MGSNIVTMVKDGKEVKVVETAYERVWKSKGWRLKGEKVAAKTEPKPEPKPETEKKKFFESATS